MKRLVKTKQKVTVEREFRILDENKNVLVSFKKMKEVEDFTEKNATTIYSHINSSEPLKTKHGKIFIEYSKKKTTITEKIDTPFEIPKAQRMVIENLPGEIWKNIPGFPECNLVSNKGRFKLVDVFGNETLGNIIYSKNKNGRKYADINIEKLEQGAFRCRLARVLVKTFIDPTFGISLSEDKRVVDHIDNNSTNNCIENLRICSSQENSMYAFYEQGSSPVKKIKKVIVEDAEGNKLEYASLNECARSFNVNPGTVFTCIKGGYKLKGIYKVSYGV